MTSLRNVSAIAEKEFRHYFGSPIAYVALFVWALLFGIFFSVIFGVFLDESVDGRMMQYGMKLSLNDRVIRPVLQNMAVIALFITPMLTMRLFAEEKRQGTMELLATSPLTDLDIILGKFVAATGLFVLMLLAGMLNLVHIFAYASNPPEWMPVLSGVLCLLLSGMASIALGCFVSTVTRNQIVAGLLSFCLAIVLWTLGWFDDPMGGVVMKVVTYLGLTTHMEDMTKGILDLKDVVFYLSFTFFGLFLCHRSLESQRWRA